MIDERHQDLAALHAFDLLEGAELTAFERELAGNAELRALVQTLRGTATEIALAAPQVAPRPELKARVLERIASATTQPAPLVRFPVPAWLPWGLAAGFAVTAAWFGQAYLRERTAHALLLDRHQLTQLEIRGAENQAEAERILSRRQFADASARIAQLSEQVDQATHKLSESTELLIEREGEIAGLARKIDSLTGASAETGRLLAEARQQITDLQRQGDLQQLKIATLASLAGNSPEALAVAVWNPTTQEGVLRVEKLPALASNQDYQLWVIDPAYETPVDGGVFSVDPATGHARITFKANKPVKNAVKFAVSLEKKGGVPKAEGPILLLGD